MIDVAAEEIFPLSRVPDRLRLARPGGKTLAISTVFRWAKGLRGVRLETIRVGGGMFTSSRCLQESFERLSAADAGPAAAPPAPLDRGSSSRRAIEAAERELDRLGV